ncbi:hypothetical protein CIPAW_01G111300 [Carya illinoinensis]|uniref:Uncharacterized protein n=1 Tax=Carya illinoinensis TaxID=32201 RepID=A0A8T1RL47_CARIL|nr:hypothetical protein CIPAW_01G111300 [Carya illinoinensis]KAG6731008.1 hypothetical protein I3842_01G109000 [Carya illinoinensis]
MSVSSSKMVHTYKALSLILFIALLISVELAPILEAKTNNIPASVWGRHSGGEFKGNKIPAPVHLSPGGPQGGGSYNCPGCGRGR